MHGGVRSQCLLVVYAVTNRLDTRNPGKNQASAKVTTIFIAFFAFPEPTLLSLLPLSGGRKSCWWGVTGGRRSLGRRGAVSGSGEGLRDLGACCYSQGFKGMCLPRDWTLFPKFRAVGHVPLTTKGAKVSELGAWQCCGGRPCLTQEAWPLGQRPRFIFYRVYARLVLTVPRFRPSLRTHTGHAGPPGLELGLAASRTAAQAEFQSWPRLGWGGRRQRRPFCGSKAYFGNEHTP